ncbi:Protein of unknown function [Gryllus bimaculatus]|nr:Protein of unknown function [Gryllus bimaculatus]
MKIVTTTASTPPPRSTVAALQLLTFRVMEYFSDQGGIDLGTAFGGGSPRRDAKNNCDVNEDSHNLNTITSCASTKGSSRF